MPPSVDHPLARRQAALQRTDTTVLRQNDRLFGHLTSQRPFEIFAASEREFFLETIDAQLSVEVDASGQGVAVTLRQNGGTGAGDELSRGTPAAFSQSVDVSCAL